MDANGDLIHDPPRAVAHAGAAARPPDAPGRAGARAAGADAAPDERVPCAAQRGASTAPRAPGTSGGRDGLRAWLPTAFGALIDPLKLFVAGLRAPGPRALAGAPRPAVSRNAGAAARGDRPAGATPRGPGARLGRRRAQFVLVVAADVAWREALARRLQAQSYLVLTAGSVREASEKLAVAPSLLILAAQLPDGSGWDLLDWLARCGREAPALIIGAGARHGTRRTKPEPILVVPAAVAVETLIAIVQEHLVAPGTAYGA